MSDSLFDKVKEIQAAVNSEHAYKSDASGYGIGDFWDFMSAGQSGDCEDFALTKMQDLIDYGVEVKNLRLMLCEVSTGQHHAVLAIITSNRGTLILDNRYDNVKLIGNVPYRFYAYQNAGQEFKSYTAKLSMVPVEYMNCHAAAFADGDEVLVEFSGQDWTSPKVIGFKKNPQTCDFDYYAFMGFSFVAEGVPEPNHAKYNSNSGTWSGLQMLPTVGDWPSSDATWSRIWVGSGGNASAYWIFGGIKYPGSQWDPKWDYPYPTLNTWDTNMVLVEKYEKIAETWSVKNTLPTPKRNDLMGLNLLGKIHLVGGTEYQYNNTEPVSAVYPQHTQYDTDGDSYQSKVNKKVCRAAEWVLDSKGYIFGGNIVNMGIHENVNDNNWTGSLSEYDPVANTWTTKNASTKRYESQGFSLPGNGYVFGGMKSTDVWNADLDEWNKDTDTWAVKTPAENEGYSYGGRPSIGYGNIAFIWSVDVPNILQPERNDHFKWSKDTDSWAYAGDMAPWFGFNGAGSAL